MRRLHILIGTVLISCTLNMLAAAPAGLVSWWPFEGNAQDVAGSNHGTLFGDPLFQNGQIGQAIHFDYVNDAMRVVANPSLNVGELTGFTIEGWIKADELMLQHPIVEWNDDVGHIGTHFWTTVQGFDGRSASLFANIVDVSGVGHVVRSDPNLLTTSRFYHVALTYDKASGTGALYLDGHRVAQEALGTFTPLTSSHFYVGFRSSGAATGNRFEGKVDELRLYNRALTPFEIQAIHSEGNSPVAPIIVTQPASRRVSVDDSVTFTVAASGTEPLAYQWRHNNVPITGAIQNSLTLHEVQATDVGAYAVTVSNGIGSVDSHDAILTVVELTECAREPAGLVAWWPFDGSAADVAGGNDGTLIGMPLFSGGKVRQAMEFDYSDDLVRVEANGTLDIGRGSGFSIEGWIKPNDLTVQHPIVEWNDDEGNIGAHFWTTVLGPDGRLPSLFANIIDVNGAAHAIRSQPGLLTTERFYHVALTYDKSTGVGALYIDGVLVEQSNIGRFTPETRSHFYIGFRSSGTAAGNRFAGKIDELSLYDRALDASELNVIYLAGNLGKCKPPTPDDALADLSRIIADAKLHRGDERPLQAAIKAARRAIEEGRIEHTIAELIAFQIKVEARLGESEPTFAQELISATDEIIAVLLRI